MVRMRRLAPLALALALLLPASAHGAGVREYQLQYAPAGAGAGSLLIVSALLDPQTPLPATVTVPVPAGSVMLWAGEILGGAPADDPSREVTMETVGDMDVYTLTLEQTYTAQLEIELPAATIDGNRLSSSVTWTNPGEEVLVTAAVIAEPGADDIEITPEVAGEVQTNDLGEKLHPLTGTRVAQGDEYAITAEWTRGSASADTPTGSSRVVPALLGALVVAIIALVVVIARERTRSRRSASADLDD